MRKTLTTLSIAAIAGAMLVGGCEKLPEDGGVPAPTTPKVAGTPTTGTAGGTAGGTTGGTTNPTIAQNGAVNGNTPAPAMSFLTIDGKQVLFPPSKLAILKNTPGDFRVRLCTDDPPSAIEPGYAGNSFLFDMKLGVDSAAALNTAPEWSGTRADFDADAGIFLNGYHNAYRPDDVHISFAGDPTDLSIGVRGTFSQPDPKDPFGPAKSVQVSGVVHVAQPGK